MDELGGSLHASSQDFYEGGLTGSDNPKKDKKLTRKIKVISTDCSNN